MTVIFSLVFKRFGRGTIGHASKKHATDVQMAFNEVVDLSYVRAN